MLQCELILLSRSEEINVYIIGLSVLAKKKLITLSITSNVITKKPIAFLKVNGLFCVIDASSDVFFRGLDFCAHQQVDVYFKYALLPEFVSSYPFRVYPLGFSYCIHSYAGLSVLDWLGKTVSWFDSELSFSCEDFELCPCLNESIHIVFFTRLLDVRSIYVRDTYSYAECNDINQIRLECLKQGREHYGSRFLGGVFKDAYSLKYFEDLVIHPEWLTYPRYLQSIHQADICVVHQDRCHTTSRDCMRYLAGAKVLMSNAMMHQTPKDFHRGYHYYQFDDAKSLLCGIDELSAHSDRMLTMMRNNYSYYHQNVRPDVLLSQLLELIEQVLRAQQNIKKK